MPPIRGLVAFGGWESATDCTQRTSLSQSSGRADTSQKMKKSTFAVGLEAAAYCGTLILQKHGGLHGHLPFRGEMSRSGCAQV